MGNEKQWSAVIPKKSKFESAQYGKETRTARGKRNMEGKNVYLSVFPEFLELLSFSSLKLTKTIELQVMRVNEGIVIDGSA